MTSMRNIMTQIALWSDDEGLELSIGQGEALAKRIIAATPSPNPVAASAVCGLRDALHEALTWHQSEDKALSKSGRTDNEYHWRRAQHGEQQDLINEALAPTQPSPNPVADKPAGETVVNALDPDMPAQEMRLHMGELSAQEMRAARSAIRWANSRRVLACLEQGQGWRDIASAPKDGSEILLTDGQTVGSGFWSDAQEAKRAEAGWFWESDRDNLLIAKNAHGVTRWSPMPPPPAAEGSR